MNVTVTQPRILPFKAWFLDLVKHFASERAARQWVADQLGVFPSVDDWGVSNLDTEECLAAGSGWAD